MSFDQIRWSTFIFHCRPEPTIVFATMSKKESVVTIARNQWNDTENRRRALERDPNLEPGNNNMYCVPKIGTQQYQEIEILANALRKAVGEKEKPLRKLNQIDATGPLVQEVQSGTGTRRMRGGGR